MFVISIGMKENQGKMTAKTIKIRDNQVEINYYQQGEGETTLLFLHGWCINSTYWENQLSYFSKSYNVYALDLPGFGQSTAERENWTIEEYAKDVNAFMDALDLKNVVLVGHSMSGEIMVQTALNNSRIVGLLGVDNFKHIDVEFTPEQMEQMSGFFKSLKEDYKNTVIGYAEYRLLLPTTLDEIKERVKNDFGASNPIAGESSLMSLMQFSESTPALLEKLNKKLYLINSDASPTNETGLKKRCKSGYEIKTIHATGHYPMIEKPLEFNQLLEEVLQGIN